jgi:large subunit ribosomal protein L22
MATTLTTPHARATARYQPVSPYKVRQVLELVRGLPVEDAERLLQLSQKDAAADILKVLDSAVSNAEHNLQLPAEELYVALAYADEGPTRKWGQPRARGRYFRIRKRTSHITIVVARYEEDELEERRRRDESRGRGAAVAQRRRAERVRRSRQAAAPDHDHDHIDEPAPAGEAVEAAADEHQEDAAAVADPAGPPDGTDDEARASDTPSGRSEGEESE